VRRARDLAAPLLAVCACLAGSAHAAPSASLHVAFAPERLGQGTTLRFSVHIAAGAGDVPPALTRLQLRFPSNLGVASSGLGIAVCSPARLQALGPEGCPVDSRMGHGSALAEFPIGPQIVSQTAELSVVRGPEQEGHLTLLFYAYSRNPLEARIVLPALLLPGPTPGDESIQIDLPPVPGLPGASDVALVALNVAVGPQGLTYHEEAHGRLVAYRPQGILLPHICPRGGFAFAAAFSFLGAGEVNAASTVPCPARRRARSAARRRRSKRAAATGRETTPPPAWRSRRSPWPSPASGALKFGP
jgi:hypothetical protein